MTSAPIRVSVCCYALVKCNEEGHPLVTGEDKEKGRLNVCLECERPCLTVVVVRDVSL